MTESARDASQGDDRDYVDWEATSSTVTPPPAVTLQWIESQVGRKVTSFEVLKGGISSAVHRVGFATGDDVVLRRYTLSEWIQREPYVPHDEARILAELSQIDVGVTTPDLVACDPEGEFCDVPALLMSVVPGRPIIDPADPTGWAERFAETLARIHRQPAIAGLPSFRRWDDPNRPPPRWTSDPDLWRHAVEIGRSELPAHPQVLIHRDYHPNNIHWDDGDQICGVVDWLSACNGPIAGDLSHCRWNLAILFDADLAAHFTDHYRSLTGYSEELRAFDLATVLSGPVGSFPTHAWNALGRSDLTSAAVATKIDQWLRVIVET